MNALEQAIAIRAEARSHNRMSRWHKSQARKQMELLARFCRENDIELQIVIAKQAETGEKK